MSELEKQDGKTPFKGFIDFAKVSPKVFNAVKGMGELGKKSQDRVFNIMDSTLSILKKELERDDLTSDERSEILKFAAKIVDIADSKDTEYKRWLFGLTGLGLGIGTLAAIKSETVRKGLTKLIK